MPMRNNVYLDNAATTKPSKEIIDSIAKGLSDEWKNPSANYSEARRLREVIEQARKDVAKTIHAKQNEIFFTSGGSESNCWAIQGFVNYWIKAGCNPIVITSTIEHKSIIDCVSNLCVSESNIFLIGVDTNGFIDTEKLEEVLKNHNHGHLNKILVSIQFANNEIGTIQHISTISELVHRYNGCFHTDGVQVVGHRPINVDKLGIDMLSASAHKFGGIKGNGFLYIKSGVNILPIIFGSQNNGMRGGTENVVGIVAMACALKEEVKLKICYSDSMEVRNKIIESLMSLPYKIRVNSPKCCYDCLPTIINVTILENVLAEALLHLLDLYGIEISSGSACNSNTNKPSHVLKAIGLNNWDSARTFRISFTSDLSDSDILYFVTSLEKCMSLLILSTNQFKKGMNKIDEYNH